jgi:hypothetical protein
MAEFRINEPINTDAPTIEVTITERNRLPIGRQRFRLIVTDEAGNVSRPDEVDVVIADVDAPTAVVRAVPNPVGFGRSFELDGRKSVDAPPGRIVRYTWTYLGPST